MDPRNFLAELKRRNVYKVAVAYAVVAWLLIQVATQVFPFLEIPNWATRLVIMLVALGFPVALILAWAFELTPEGIKRAEDVSQAEAFSSRKRGKWMIAVVVVAMAALALLIMQLVKNRSRPATVEIPSNNAIPQKSIAVLPFENLSRDPDNAFFASGIQEEILTRLAKISALKVISRTSTQQYQSKPGNLREIAQQLGVANILEGSVQKSADQVRVNVQLINAMTDAHLWADTFDRKLTDIFQIESEIAKTIADTLQAKLTGSEQHAIAAQPTQNTEAHQLYLKGRYFWNKRTGPDLRKAIDYFKQAIEKDPKYAVAYAGLADSYVLLSRYGAGTPQESFPPAKAAAKKALEIDDTLAEAHTSLGFILCFYDLDFASSIKEFERAIALNPNYATAHHWFGGGGPLLLVGEFDRAIAEAKRAVELDPLSLIINADLGTGYFVQRRYDEAIEQLRRTLEIDSRFYYAHWNLGEALELKGQLREALNEYKKAAELDDDPFVLGLVAQAYAKLGQRDEAVKILEQMQQLATRRYVAGYSFALVHMALGEKDKAVEWLERAYRDRAGVDIAFIKIDPMLDPLHGDPRFEALVQKIFAAK